MSVQYYPNGIGGTVGDYLDTCRPLQTTGNVWYVSSLVGTDAAAPAGQNREKPLATLAQAVTNANSGDIIVFLQGHTQTLVAKQTIAKSLILIGEGITDGKPGVSFIMNAAATVMFELGVANIELRNLYFPPNLQTNTAPRVDNTVGNQTYVGCYFECGATDTGPAVRLSDSGQRFESCTFISVATSTAAQPFCAIATKAGFGVASLVMEDCVFSAGPYGFSNFAAVDFTPSSATQMRLQGISLLLGADMALGATSTGHVNIQTSTGGSRVSWA